MVNQQSVVILHIICSLLICSVLPSALSNTLGVTQNSEAICHISVIGNNESLENTISMTPFAINNSD